MQQSKVMEQKTSVGDLAAWIFGIVVLTIGILNFLWVHWVPGTVFVVLSILYFPPTNIYLKARVGFVIPTWVKIVLGIVIIMFTFGVSDLGDIIDKWSL